MTPYVDGERVVVTSTLAYIRKTEQVRRDGRVALLAGGVHVTGEAGGDEATLITLDVEGMPRIRPLAIEAPASSTAVLTLPVGLGVDAEGEAARAPSPDVGRGGRGVRGGERGK